MTDTFHARRLALRERAREQDVAAVVIGLSSNLRYLTGFIDEPGERMLLLVVPQSGEAAMIVPGLYESQVRSVSSVARILIWADEEDPRKLLESVARNLPTGRVLVDDSLWAQFVLSIDEVVAPRPLGLASELLTDLRARKGVDEVECMKKAGRIADRALEQTLAAPLVGQSELEVAHRLESAMMAGGADGIAFETLIAAGENSALPHYRAGHRTIRSGDVVILDFGCRVAGYCSDMTRTVICGAPSAAVSRAYEAVRGAYEAGRAAVRPGVEAQNIDRAARAVLTEAGYGAAFCHRTGHGVGLDVHEPPYIVGGNRTALEPGMAFSIEPGAYFEGSFGLRLEDVVVVGDAGAIPMTNAPRELRVVE